MLRLNNRRLGPEDGYFFMLWLYAIARIKIMIIAAIYSIRTTSLPGEWLTALSTSLCLIVYYTTKEVVFSRIFLFYFTASSSRLQGSMFAVAEPTNICFVARCLLNMWAMMNTIASATQM